MMEKESIAEPKGAVDCASAKCSMDAGCRRESDSSWICICTHDLSIQRADRVCPRVVVAQYPRNTDEEDRFIRMWENESIKTWMMGDRSNSDEISLYSNNGWMLALTILLLIVIIGVITVFLIIKRRQKYHRRQQDCIMLDQFESVVTTEQQYSGTKDEFILLREWIKLEEEIGQGCFGLVYRGRYQRPGAAHSETVAVKVLKTTNRAADENELIREAQTMATFSHPNILAALGIVFNEGITGRTWLVFEYMSMGDLTHLLRTSTADSSLGANGFQPISLREIHLMSMAEQIASGMAYLSTQRFIHRDLACRNCLVNQLHSSNNSIGAVYFVVKISDFGMSRDVYTTDYYRMGGSQSVLPVRWMSPESILYGTFTTKSDVWSYGVVLWEIFTMGAQPYYGQSNEEAVRLILDGVLLDMPDSVPPVIQQIYDGCSKSLPVDRLHFHQIENKLIADQQRRVPRSQGIVSNYIIPNPIVLDGHVRSDNRIQVIFNEDPVVCREIEGDIQAAAASTLPVDDAYLQLVIHTDSTGENLSINIASPNDYA